MSVMEGSLDGLAMFVGMNHTFALKASDFPGLKPDSIYFTDAHQLTSKYYGGHDIGIFDFHDKTTSPCYYPIPHFDDDVLESSSITSIVPPPMWFTPSL
ncbi:hypothetical protein PHJA_000039400 [Phtheirospermum japonicum]|uniref:KIB1-4 beta-propeller domain-containing protein n=1 Tax=Phtheirospermum japonicum TaxID=374723 RepID=A0A830B129_9LAMI|nr:hypothetical protein PHJA_000039400 [Phtheirospermum japonicum]